ncbi:hypothetical protein OROMI_021825 [Orobanche minor]
MNRLFSTSSSPQDEATSGGVAVTSPDQNGGIAVIIPAVLILGSICATRNSL